LCCGRIICISIISYGKIHFDIRVFWITSTFLERIMLAIQGSTVLQVSLVSLIRAIPDIYSFTYQRHYIALPSCQVFDNMHCVAVLIPKFRRLSISKYFFTRQHIQVFCNCVTQFKHFKIGLLYTRGSGSSVGIATGYGMDGPGNESR
jgi:hypothetical protein